MFPYAMAVHAPLVGNVVAAAEYVGLVKLILGSIRYELEESGETIVVPGTW